MALTGSGLARAPHGFFPKISGRLREAGGAFRRKKVRRRPGGAENGVRGGENAAPVCAFLLKSVIPEREIPLKSVTHVVTQEDRNACPKGTGIFIRHGADAWRLATDFGGIFYSGRVFLGACRNAVFIPLLPFGVLPLSLGESLWNKVIILNVIVL